MARAVGFHGRPAQQRGDSLDQLENAERLRHVLVGVELEAAHLVRFLGAGAQDDHRNPRTLRPDRAQDFVAIHARQHQVEQDEIGRERPVRVDGFRAVRRDHRLVTLELQVERNALGQVGIVFDDEDASHQTAARDSGSDTVNRAPPPGAASTQARPPC